ncbi:DUF6087 family protein [Streptomyces sp. NPDC006463]|uniref:DUF6087 family protein n=1 Tax=Streptomyces sp. NPDC006463 TaxID=3364746 RepID=UPI00368CB013
MLRSLPAGPTLLADPSADSPVQLQRAADPAISLPLDGHCFLRSARRQGRSDPGSQHGSPWQRRRPPPGARPRDAFARNGLRTSRHGQAPPSRTTRPTLPRIDAADPLARYDKRRRPPRDIYRRHRPVHGGANHLRPDEPRVLEQWDGFTYEVIGTTPDLVAAREWVNEIALGDDLAA